jgi:hypothetical protein
MNKKSWRHHLKTQIWKFGIILEITIETSYCRHRTKKFMKKLIWNPTIKNDFWYHEIVLLNPHTQEVEILHL